MVRHWPRARAAALVIALGVVSIGHGPSFKDIMTVWQTAVDNDPDNWVACQHLGTRYAQRAKMAMDNPQAANRAEARADLNSAVNLYKRVISLNPDHAVAYHNLGNAIREIGFPNDALHWVNLAIEKAVRADGRNPPLAEMHVSRGTTYRAIGQPDKALADFDEAIRLDDTCANAYLNRGNMRINRDELTEAIDDYTRALSSPGLVNRAGVLDNRGIAYRLLARKTNDWSLLDKALADHNAAINLNPTLSKAYSHRAWVYHLRGRNDEALKELELCRRKGGQVDAELLRLIRQRMGGGR